MTDQGPNAWPIVPLGQLGQWGSGGTPRRGVDGYYKGPIPWLKIGDLTDGVVTTSEESISAEGLRNSSAKLVEPGTLLIAMYGSIGKLGIPAMQCATNQAIAFCAPDRRKVSTDYLFHALLALRSDLIAQGKGGTQSNISQTVLKAFGVPVPPLPVQERIVTLARRTLEMWDQTQAHLVSASRLLLLFRQSILAAAASGRLSREWRAMHGLDESQATAEFSSLDEDSVPPGWQRATPPEICDAIVDCPHSTPKYGEGERFAIDTNSMSSRGIDLTRLRRVTTEVFNARNRRLEPSPGDIVFAREGTVGTAVELPESPRLCLGQRVMLMRPGQKVLPGFLRLALMSPLVRQQYVQKILGTTAPHLNVRDVVALELLIPPLDEQSEIVRAVATLFALTDGVTTRIESAFSSSESCMQSFLARRFQAATNMNEPEDSNGSGS